MSMSKEEQEAILELNRYIYGKQISKSDIADYLGIVFGTVSKLQKENEKQSKVIDEMAGYLAIIRDCPNEDKGANLDCENRCNNTDEIYEECWKQYFYRKVENE